jgi:hypothetical protein
MSHPTPARHSRRCALRFDYLFLAPQRVPEGALASLVRTDVSRRRRMRKFHQQQNPGMMAGAIAVDEHEIAWTALR